MKKLLTGQDDQVAQWVEARIPMMELGEVPYSAIGLLDRRGYLTAGVVFNQFTRTDVHLHIALLNVRSLSRRFIEECFRYVFWQLACARCTVMVASRNERSLRFVQKVGWRWEGTIRELLPDGDDVHVFGMLRSECRWLRSPHGNRCPDATRPTNTRRGSSTLPIGGPDAGRDGSAAGGAPAQHADTDADAGGSDGRRGRSTLPIPRRGDGSGHPAARHADAAASFSERSRTDGPDVRARSQHDSS